MASATPSALKIHSFTTPLGAVGVVWSDRGVASVALADTVDKARDQAAIQLSARHHGGIVDEAPNGPWGLIVARALTDMTPEAWALVAGIPLDTHGTSFEEKVWSALRGIPVGHTQSYAEVAQSVSGGARHARAVARACAHNPCAVVVPCHRVTRSSGENVGFRWGLDRKNQMLLAEQAIKS